jgi:hypothetical protein
MSPEFEEEFRPYIDKALSAIQDRMIRAYRDPELTDPAVTFIGLVGELAAIRGIVEEIKSERRRNIRALEAQEKTNAQKG